MSTHCMQLPIFNCLWQFIWLNWSFYKGSFSLFPHVTRVSALTASGGSVVGGVEEGEGRPDPSEQTVSIVAGFPPTVCESPRWKGNHTEASCFLFANLSFQTSLTMKVLALNHWTAFQRMLSFQDNSFWKTVLAWRPGSPSIWFITISQKQSSVLIVIP